MRMRTGNTAMMPCDSSRTRGSIDLAPRTETTFQNKSELSRDGCVPFSCRQTSAAGVHLKARMSSDADVAGFCSVLDAFQRPSSCSNGCKDRRRHLDIHCLSARVHAAQELNIHFTVQIRSHHRLFGVTGNATDT